MTLSPAAQAVIKAYNAAPPNGIAECAAVLRAAVEQIRASDKGELSDTIEDVLRGAEREHICGFLSSISTELETHHD